MARLINADALKDAMRKKFKTVQERCEVNEVINAAPTIDAIPVEWLIRKRGSIHPAVTVGSATDWLLDEWQKEQEVNDT